MKNLYDSNSKAEVYVLASHLRARLNHDQFQCYLNQLPLGLQEEVEKYRNWKDAQGRLIGKLLLKIGLMKYFHATSSILNEINYTRRARPFIPDADFDFNISHSGNTVVCCIASGMNVGVDIEEIKPIEISDFNDQLSSAEMENIKKSKHQIQKFYSYWTKKEAVMKAEGFGLGFIPLHQVTFNDREDQAAFFWKTWFLYQISLEKDVNGCLAVDKKLRRNKLLYETISFDEPIVYKQFHKSLTPA
ncbi:MAG TPA: 4'-phosphopantetheinyl transferase superfamily protein [Cyclobacteriaceae bacterium]|jgi:4'-phosphopantetheinyl transferase|nr:4'-phosphopantetheinyl transferase superfamily protein [Cyclobacteriaceae bacterium]